MSIEKSLAFFIEATRLFVLHGMILITPAKEIKRMKLRQIEKELKTLLSQKSVTQIQGSEIRKNIRKKEGNGR